MSCRYCLTKLSSLAQGGVTFNEDVLPKQSPVVTATKVSDFRGFILHDQMGTVLESKYRQFDRGQSYESPFSHLISVADLKRCFDQEGLHQGLLKILAELDKDLNVLDTNFTEAGLLLASYPNLTPSYLQKLYRQTRKNSGRALLLETLTHLLPPAELASFLETVYEAKEKNFLQTSLLLKKIGLDTKNNTLLEKMIINGGLEKINDLRLVPRTLFQEATQQGLTLSAEITQAYLTEQGKTDLFYWHQVLQGTTWNEDLNQAFLLFLNQRFDSTRTAGDFSRCLDLYYQKQPAANLAVDLKADDLAKLFQNQNPQQEPPFWQLKLQAQLTAPEQKDKLTQVQKKFIASFWEDWSFSDPRSLNYRAGFQQLFWQAPDWAASEQVLDSFLTPLKRNPNSHETYYKTLALDFLRGELNLRHQKNFSEEQKKKIINDYYQTIKEIYASTWGSDESYRRKRCQFFLAYLSNCPRSLGVVKTTWRFLKTSDLPPFNELAFWNANAPERFFNFLQQHQDILPAFDYQINENYEKLGDSFLTSAAGADFVLNQLRSYQKRQNSYSKVKEFNNFLMLNRKRRQDFAKIAAPQKERFNTMLLKAIEEKVYQQEEPPLVYLSFLKETGTAIEADKLRKIVQKYQPTWGAETTAACQILWRQIRERAKKTN